jgi:hypothetical protein
MARARAANLSVAALHNDDTSHCSSEAALSVAGRVRSQPSDGLRRFQSNEAILWAHIPTSTRSRLRPAPPYASSHLRPAPTYARSHLRPFPLTPVPAYARSRLRPFPLTAIPTHARSHLRPFPKKAHSRFRPVPRSQAYVSAYADGAVPIVARRSACASPPMIGCRAPPRPPLDRWGKRRCAQRSTTVGSGGAPRHESPARNHATLARHAPPQQRSCGTQRMGAGSTQRARALASRPSPRRLHAACRPVVRTCSSRVRTHVAAVAAAVCAAAAAQPSSNRRTEERPISAGWAGRIAPHRKRDRVVAAGGSPTGSTAE